MKTSLIFLCLLFSITAYCQPDPVLVKLRTKIDTLDKEAYYQDVVKLDTSLKKNIVFSRAKQFAASTLTSSNSQLNYESESEGKIIFVNSPQLFIKQGFGSLPFNTKYTFTIEVKDGRYRYTVNNIEMGFNTLVLENGKREFLFKEWLDCKGGKSYNNHYKRIVSFENHLFALIDNMNSIINQSSAATKSDF